MTSLRPASAEVAVVLEPGRSSHAREASEGAAIASQGAGSPGPRTAGCVRERRAQRARPEEKWGRTRRPHSVSHRLY
jgi:hypothetical protein